MRAIRQWLRDESGQDFTEYTLLIAFVALVSAALFLTNQDSVVGIWTTSTNKLIQANARVQ